MATTFTTFGPDTPLIALPTDMAACITGGTSPDCDTIMGSAEQKLGYCSNPLYKTQTYCACVNSPTTDAPCFFAPCTNNAHAYQTVSQQRMLLDRSCPPNAVICSQILQVGGRDNIVSGTTMQCGVITNVTNIIKANPYIAVTLFVLILLLVMVIAMRPEDSNERPLPPELALSLMNPVY